MTEAPPWLGLAMVVTQFSLSQPQFAPLMRLRVRKEGGEEPEASVTGEAVLGALVISETESASQTSSYGEYNCEGKD